MNYRRPYQEPTVPPMMHAKRNRAKVSLIFHDFLPNSCARARALNKRGPGAKYAREFPDLKVEQRAAPCSNGVRGSTARRIPPSGIEERFPVGHSHKQGLELITPGTDLQSMGGKKT